MVKLLRYVAAIALAVWIGSIVNTLAAARSIFDNESGHVPDSGIAGDIVGPLLHNMHVTGWIACGVALVAILLIRKIRPARRNMVIWATGAVLLIALLTGVYSGIVLTEQIQDIRIEIAEAYGTYDAAPKESTLRSRFGALHGLSMGIAMLNLVLALGTFYTVTQKIGIPAEMGGEFDPAELEEES